MIISKVQSFNLLNRSRQIPVNPAHAQNLKHSQFSNEISNVYYYPINFKSEPRTYSSDNKKLQSKTYDFKICRIPDVPCPACGKKIMTKSQFDKFAYDLANTQPDDFLDFLGNYTEYMRPVEESVYYELKALSAKMAAQGKTVSSAKLASKGENALSAKMEAPSEDFKDLRTLVVKLRDEKLTILQKTQRRILKKMIALAKTLPANEQATLMAKINSVKEIMNQKLNSPFRRKILIEDIKQIKISNPKKYNRLQNLARSFPTSTDMNSAWIVKYSGKDKHGEDWTSYDIALRLLQVSTASTDHILAYDIENNHDDISNYFSMHSGCNNVKANKPFMQWFNEDKEGRLKYLKDYFNFCDELIKTKRIKRRKYRQYVAAATQTICDITQGQVDLRPSLEQEFMQ